MPLLTVSRRASDSVRTGHLWVYRTDVQQTAEAAMLNPGSLVTVVDSRRLPLGTAIYSSSSQIAARMVSREPELTRKAWLDELRIRLRAAFTLRAQMVPAPSLPMTSLVNDACRLVFSEADNLPGIVIDRYADLVVVQLLTQATAGEDVRAVVVDELRAWYGSGGSGLTIWERPDPRIRELEDLPPATAAALFTTEGDAPTTTGFHMNGLRFGYDAGAGQKTGAFLDQRLNYAAAADVVKHSGLTGRALDICTYHGGFALHLAQVCSAVTGVDASHSALAAADANLLRNPHLTATVDWVEADAFDLLRALDDAARSITPASSSLPIAAGTFDAIVLDPPAFAKTKRAAEAAMRGYKELNLRAMRLLAPGGTLVTCSCSHHVSEQAFVETVTAAALDAGRRVQVLAMRGAAPDHPHMLALPETQYLKCMIARVA